MKVLAADPNKCLGCRICEQWCSMFHFRVNNPKKSRISVVRSHETYMDYPFSCQQCADTPCIKACPVKIQALSVDENTGAIKVDEEKCIACGLCVKACPNQAIKKHPTEKHMLICDLCGGDPQCVKHCPGDALFYN
ncbi:4Fe-4S dicluster domain-containing protein [Desulfotomaculum sp. 1211_IL3151]|uniref:4Fe-4S dicluster domain-containing protein n=1 Tax=Desulfotomaculum sp. 1211_IL3151 TaxID=3084055 RepID=UPI002FDA4C6A